MKKSLVLLALALFAAAPVASFSAEETAQLLMTDKPSSGCAALPVSLPTQSSEWVARETAPVPDADPRPTLGEGTQVAGYISWFVWCPSLGTFTCRTCCPPGSR
jgi:hypothetical protein